MRQIVPQIYTFNGLLAGRVYMLQDQDGLTLVDASISNAGPKILAQIQQAGHHLNEVKRILITHAHPDHVGSLPALVEATGAEVWCHALEKPVVQGEAPIARRPSGITPPETKVAPTPVSRTLNPNEMLPILGGLQVIFTPGHAPGHLSFWLPERRLLITGDAIFHMMNPMTLPFAFLTVDMEENKRSIRKIIDLQPDSLLFGHGLPVIGQARAKLAEFAKRIGIN